MAKLTSRKIFIALGVLTVVCAGIWTVAYRNESPKLGISEARRKANQEHIDKTTEINVNRITRDQENGRLTAEEAALIRDKIAEIKAYINEHPDEALNKAKLIPKEREWRNWASQNRIPYFYIDIL